MPEGEPDTLTAGPVKGDFIAPPEAPDADERLDALPAQEEFWRPPVRFGSVPVEKEPLGWDRRRAREKIMHVSLPVGGQATMPMQKQFWGTYFGMCADKVGIQWMVSYQENSA
jgi:hypothetical protein